MHCDMEDVPAIDPGGVPTPPYMTEENLAEFNELFDLTHRALSRRSPHRDAALSALLEAGPGAVRPLAYAIEVEIWDNSATDDDIDDRAERVADIVRRIDEPALPELESLVEDGDCNIYVNEWAQEMVFDIMGLDAAGRQRVCHHGTRMRFPEEGVWRYLQCDAEFGDGEHPTEEISPVDRRGRPTAPPPPPRRRT